MTNKSVSKSQFACIMKIICEGNTGFLSMYTHKENIENKEVGQDRERQK